MRAKHLSSLVLKCLPTGYHMGSDKDRSVTSEPGCKKRDLEQFPVPVDMRKHYPV